MGEAESRRRENETYPRISWEILREMEKREDFEHKMEDLIE